MSHSSIERAPLPISSIYMNFSHSSIERPPPPPSQFNLLTPHHTLHSFTCPAGPHHRQHLPRLHPARDAAVQNHRPPARLPLHRQQGGRRPHPPFAAAACLEGEDERR